MPPKIRIVFVGAGILSLISVKRFLDAITQHNHQHRYDITVIEQGSEGACGTTFGNGGNLTPIEGLPAIEPTASFHALPLHPATARHLGVLGKYSMQKTLDFFISNPTMAQACAFQYSAGEEREFACLYVTNDLRQAHLNSLHALDIPFTPLAADAVRSLYPVLAHSSLPILSATCIEGGCLNARQFALALIERLSRDGVTFRYHCSATAPFYQPGTRQITGLLVTSSGDTAPPQRLAADMVVIGTGCDTQFLNTISPSPLIYPVGGCTLTVPVDASIAHYPTRPFKLITPDGWIVFSPHLSTSQARPSHVRIGGISWYDPSMDASIDSPHAQHGLSTLKGALKEVLPELYDHTLRRNQFDPWVGFRPYAFDYLPLIGETMPGSGIWLNIGHGPGGTSYGFGAADLLIQQLLPHYGLPAPSLSPDILSPARIIASPDSSS